MRKDLSSEFVKSLEYNRCLCEGLLKYEEGNESLAYKLFEESTLIYPEKPEGYFYMSLISIKQHIKNENEELILSIRNGLDLCILNLREMNNNYAAEVYYIKSLFSAYIGEWEDALT